MPRLSNAPTAGRHSGLSKILRGIAKRFMENRDLRARFVAARKNILE
jgi:hypothetical protein